MGIIDMQVIGNELAIKAEGIKKGNKSEDLFVDLKKMRQNCPCALCCGEKDLTGGTIIQAKKNYQNNSFQIKSLELIGNYAIRPTWYDGHESGIFAIAMLQKLSS